MPLRELADFRNGKGHEKNIVPDGQFIVVNSKYISTDGKVAKYTDSQICPLFKDDICLVMSDLPNGKALAKCRLIDEDDRYSLNQRIGAFTNKDNEKVINKYLFYILNRNPQLLRYDNGTDQTNLKKDEILDISIPVPSKKIQERIVYVLDNFDAVCNDLNIGLPAEIEARQKQYEYYRNRLLRFDAAVGGDTERERGVAKLRQYIFGCTLVQLNLVAGYSKSRISSSELDGNTFVGVDNLLQNKLGKTTSEHIPESGNWTKYSPEDILIGNIRPYLRKIWFANNTGGASGDVLVIRNDFEQLNSRYLYHVLSSEKLFEYNDGKSKGSKMPRGDKAAIMEYSFIIPTLEKQKEIASTLDEFDKLTNDIVSGLPAEIKARHKQYEYYRDKLLTFSENSVI